MQEQFVLSPTEFIVGGANLSKARSGSQPICCLGPKSLHIKN